MSPPNLTADRVRLEAMRPAHASEMFSWMREPALYRFLPQAPPHDVTALAATLRRWTGGAPSPRERWWNWVVRAEDVPGTPIVGHVQLTFTLSSDVLVAWVFGPAGRGRGLATEATERALRHVADGAPRVAEATAVAFVDRLNEPSIALAERLGLRRVAPHATAAGHPAVGTISPVEIRFERPLPAFATAEPPHDVITCREATAADLGTLRAYSRAMWLDMGRPESLFHADWAERFDRRHGELRRHASLCSFVAERGGLPVGSASLHVYESISPPMLARRVAYVWGVYVRPEVRGRGVARALTERCVAAARALRCDRVVLHASKQGRPVYERLGFRTSNEMVLELD